MSYNVADVRDAIMQADAEVEGVVEEVITEFYMPDLLTQAALMVELMPDDAWNLVDDETKDRLAEVL